MDRDDVLLRPAPPSNFFGKTQPKGTITIAAADSRASIPRAHHGISIRTPKRHGTTTLFAALNILDGTVIGHNMKRHRHQALPLILMRLQPSQLALF
jgi:hypothetical protein